MSAFTNNQEKRVQALVDFAKQMITTSDKAALVNAHQELIRQVTPSEVIAMFDVLVAEQKNLPELKTATNKILHLFHSPLLAYPALKPSENSFLDVLARNNREMESLLKSMKPDIKQLNLDPANEEARKSLLVKMEKLRAFDLQYQIKENVLFPALENHWPDYRCVQLMWSYQDDIRREMKALREQLEAPDLELKQFNRTAGDLFFNMLAIRFREEHILFPHILETIRPEVIQQMLSDSSEIGFPYVSAEKIEQVASSAETGGDWVNLETGNLKADQIIRIFNHLPVDITFVDEHDTVRYFSTPKKRIFPRTKAIIGRKVHNCHPPESVHVVEEIVSAFRSGTKDEANFWINFKSEKILIQYFAVRDEAGEYKGVIEVTQEISGIQQLTGEKRLLDWEK
ncbi:MAG: DUF438 domain-containing protein [Mangrovibacterium sp.]